MKSEKSQSDFFTVAEEPPSDRIQELEEQEKLMREKLKESEVIEFTHEETFNLERALERAQKQAEKQRLKGIGRFGLDGEGAGMSGMDDSNTTQ